MANIINIQKPEYRIYRDGQYQMLETWKPVIKHQLADAAYQFNYWLCKHEWVDAVTARSIA